MEKETITEFMTKEHGKILFLLTNFKNKKDKESLTNLKNVQERHILAEEKAIMTLEKENIEFPEMITILEQHGQLKNLLKVAEDNPDDKTIKPLLDLMKIHINLENKKFYPRLDKDLEGNQRQVIFDQLHEAILGNIMK